ncbi:hypothetical protein [Clostridium sp. FP1]|uniref:hypothetical protein n=1 Tax=Clostridium sp. FP1 TaxID=2724076 RepID=UPI0013E997C8|nr:hypothetical protein [Clostridium sp. FP1]MBZ9633041.1 hypothetical protein [Clostridium sp. FP1]
MGKLKKIAYQIESGEVIYVHQRVIKGITKSAYITKQYVEEHPRRLIIEYRSKKFNSHGSMEIIDLGPDKSKKNIKEEN